MRCHQCLWQMVCGVLIATSVTTDASWSLPKDDSHIDFSNISFTLNRLFHDPLDIECKMPQKAVIVTYSNKHHMQLLSLQRQSMNLAKAPNRACLAERFLTVCLDPDCFTLCNSMHLYNCVLVHTTSLDFPPSTYLQGAFFYLSFIKYLIIREVFKQASEAFFVDADVLIYCNPWHAGIFADTRFDFIYSVERTRRREKMNGGQYFLRNTKKVQLWLRLMIQAREIICNPVHNYKQHTSGSSFSQKKIISSPTISRQEKLTRQVRPTKRFLQPMYHKGPPLLDQDYARIFADQVDLKTTWAPLSHLGAHNHHPLNMSAIPRNVCTNHICGVTGTFSSE